MSSPLSLSSTHSPQLVLSCEFPFPCCDPGKMLHPDIQSYLVSSVSSHPVCDQDLYSAVRPKTPPSSVDLLSVHVQRGHGHISRNCFVCLFKVYESQSHIFLSLQFLFHQSLRVNTPSAVPLPLLEPCCSSPISHSAILLILPSRILSNTFRLSNVIPRYFQES